MRGNADWTPQRLAWLGLLMSWDEGQTLRARWEHACQMAKESHAHWCLGDSYSGFTQALIQETPRLVEALKTRFRRELQSLPARFQACEGWQAFSIDGSRQEAPHTRANEQGLGCAGRDKTAPQVFLTTILHLGTGLPWDFRVGPGTDSERQHLREMIGELPARSLLVADAGFVGYELCRDLMESKRFFLWRVGGNVRLLKDLGYYERQRHDIVYLWPCKEQKKHNPPLVLRLIRLRRGKKTVYLISNVLSRRELPNTQAAWLYKRRWGHEVFFRSCKQTLERRKLLSRTPATCLVESQWTLLGLWLLGLMTATQVIQAGGDPCARSVARARDVVRDALRNQRPQRCRRRLLNQLADAVKDDYRRRRPKAARNYPRKKREKPPGPPKIESAKVLEIQRAARLEPVRIELKWTA